MFRFDTYRFCKLYLWYQNVAASIVELRNPGVIEVHVFPQDGAAIDSLVVDGDFILRDVIVNDHLTRADNDHLSHLLRVQPADMNVRDDLSRILQIKEDNVIDSFLHVGHALTADRNRFPIAQPILNDADIVGGEVPKGVNVGTNAPKIQALAIDIAELAELAGVDQFLHVTDSRVIDESMARHHDKVPLTSASREIINLSDRSGERLLYENVFAGVEDLPGEGEMTCGGRRNHHTINTGIVEDSSMRVDRAAEREI